MASTTVDIAFIEPRILQAAAAANEARKDADNDEDRVAIMAHCDQLNMMIELSAISATGMITLDSEDMFVLHFWFDPDA